MAEKLTPEQHLAVHNRGGKLLVSAAAGSGKTKVLVDRLLSYILDPVQPANVDDFLMITYTKAAASELRGKIAAKLTQAIADAPENRHLQRQMQRLYLAKISTVHSFCADVLREYAYRLDIAADFRVADESECRQLRSRTLEQLLENAYALAGENADFRAFIDTQGLGRDDRQIPEIILQVYNSARCHLNPDEWLSWCVQASSSQNVTDAASTVWGQYLIQDLHGYLDFQLEALQKCLESANRTEGMERPAALLTNTVAQLSALRSCGTWEDVISHSRIDFGRLVFSKKCGNLDLAEQIKAVRSACKKGLEKKLRSFADASGQVLQDLQATGNAARGLVSLVRQFAADFEKAKRVRRILDFGDLEHKTLDLLLGKSRSGITQAANDIGVRFREIMVDEYQDSNAVQDAIFSALTHNRQNCFMVGDVKQSIYQFRLADPEIFIEKYNNYVNAADETVTGGRKVLLSSNFRSSNGVIQAVNNVFSLCMSPRVGGLHYGSEEMLREGIEHSSLGEPEVSLYGIAVEEDTYGEESAFVADEIARLLDGTHMVRSGDGLRPITPEDIVILLRSPGSVGGEFRYALESRGIPCTTGDSADLLATEEISTIRALLQVISNPMQDIPLLAVLTSPVFCFTAEELAYMRSQNRQSDIFTLLQQSDTEKAVCFLRTLAVLRKEAKRYGLSRFLTRILLHTRLDSIYATKEDGDEKVANIQSFCQIAAAYESTGHKDLEQFLDYLQSMEECGLIVPGAEKTGGAVTIMSIHKSKGLEFPVVFLCGLSRMFNQENTRAQVLCHKELGLGLCCVDTVQRIRYPSIAKRAIAAKLAADGISEEMRVLYVGMTRAKDRLIMTYAARNLENHLREMALRMDLTSPVLMTSEADCPGAWVLMTALRRTEAGAFFQLCGHTPDSGFREPAWNIQIVNGTENAVLEERAQETARFPQQWVDRLKNSLSFTYAHAAATQIPSKQTATQLKGRVKDQEVAENTVEQEKRVRKFRLPSFVKDRKEPNAYGNAVHAVMQYIRYQACTSADNIRQELARMQADGLITSEQAELIDCEKIWRFFATPIGSKLQSGISVLREFKFSVLVDANLYYPDVTDEQVLLQGVADCAILEPDGITVIDFKTDYVTQASLPQVVERYRPQVMAYTQALSRIYKTNIKEAMLYFFNMDGFVSVLDSEADSF